MEVFIWTGCLVVLGFCLFGFLKRKLILGQLQGLRQLQILLARGIFPRIWFNIFGSLKIASLFLLALFFPTGQAQIFDPVFPTELEASMSLSCICWHLQQPNPHHYQTNENPSQPKAEKARSWSLLYYLTCRVINTPVKYADMSLLLPRSKVQLRDSWLFLSINAGHFVSHQCEPWKPGNSLITKFMTYTISYCLFLSNNLKTVRRGHPVNGFHKKHPPAAQGAYSICEQKGSCKSPERKVWEVNNIFCQTLFPFWLWSGLHSQSDMKTRCNTDSSASWKSWLKGLSCFFWQLSQSRRKTNSKILEF